MSDKNNSSDKNENKKKAKDKRNTDSENRCPICLDSITNNCRTDPCSHEFCLQCLRHWTTDHNFCPVCRQVFDRILYNFRDNEFDSIDVDNRQSRVRRSLINQRDVLRENLTRLRARADQQIEVLRRRLQTREGMRNRIDEQLGRIDSMDRQNNDEMDQTLNQVRNTINEYNYQQFVDGMSGPLIMPEINRILGPFPGIHALPWNDSDSLVVNRNGSSSGSMRRLSSASMRSTSNSSGNESGHSSGPTSIEWQIHGPNSVGTVSVTSDDTDNHSVRSIRSTIFSQSMPDLNHLEDRPENPFIGLPPLASVPHLQPSHLGVRQNMLQMLNSLRNEEPFQQRTNHMMNNNFELFRQPFHSGPAFNSFNGNDQAGPSTGFRPNGFGANNGPNRQIPRNAPNFGNVRNSLPRSATLQRNMDWLNQFNQRQRNLNQMVDNTNHNLDEIDPGYESDIDLD